MKKILNPVKTSINKRVVNTFVVVEIKDGRLSLTGVQGPKSNGNAHGSCGQIVDELNRDVDTYSEGWSRETVEKLQDIWERWHLNDMRAGTPAQEEFIREWKKSNKYDYTAACEALKEAGLYENNGYKYGHGWLKEEVPQEVIDWLLSLPETTINPAWC